MYDESSSLLKTAPRMLLQATGRQQIYASLLQRGKRMMYSYRIDPTSLYNCQP